MRITGGEAAGKYLSVPKGLGVRPTPEKVRQAIFNSIGILIEETSILELFGGSGALSLESLSRGATKAVCVEKSAKHARFIKSNAKACGFDLASFEVIAGDAFTHAQRFKDQEKTFDFIMADPPYGDKNVGFRSQSLAQKTVDDLNLPSVLKPDGLFIIGHAKRDQIEIPIHWREKKSLKHGDNWIRILTLPES